MAALGAGPAMADCPAFPAPQINITPSFSAPRYNFQQNLAQLRQIAEVESAAILHKDQPVGLAVGELSIGMTMEANAAFGNDGAVCARPSVVNIDLGFKNNTVYVARELPRRTCGHEEILEHEEGHVEIDRQLLKEYIPIAQRYLQAAVDELGYARAKTPDEAKAKMQDFMSQHLKQLADDINKERVKRQAEHDSVAEYKRLSAVCGGAVSQLVAEKREVTEQSYQRNVRRSSAYGSRNDDSRY